MDKKYLMLIPLAIPLFFGGKAAVTAIKSKGGIGSRRRITEEDIIREDAHIDEMRTAVEEPALKEDVMNQKENEIKEPDEEITPPSEEEIRFPDEEEISPDSPVNMDAEMPINDDVVIEKTIITGPKGGKYYLDDSGRKIYLKKQ